MIKRNKLWTSISAVTLAGVASVGITACDSSSNDVRRSEQKTEQNALLKDQTKVESDMSESTTAAVIKSGGEGEGEGEGVSDLGTDDIAYLTQLALMRGHLFVGSELYKGGHIEHAKTHMKHPKSELYAAIAPAFVARGDRGFSDELVALSNSVENEAEYEVVLAAYNTLVSAITESEKAISATSLVPAQRLKLVSEIMRVAGEEYAIAVVDGVMQNPHEYQDALGFTAISTRIIESINSSSGATQRVKEKALEHINNLKPHWPSLIPPNRLDTQASALYVTAARIELLSLGLK